MTGQRTLPDTEPIAVSDKVRDVMLFTVPGLKDEEDDPIVAPDVPMRDDGAAGRFAKAFIHDEIPWMDVSNEVRDLMFLAVPSIDVPADDLIFADEEIPVDDMEAHWFVIPEAVDETVSVEEPEVPVPETQPMVAAPAEAPAMAISAPAVTLSIHAPAAVHMLAMPAPVHALAEAQVEVPEVPVAEESLAEEIPVIDSTEIAWDDAEPVVADETAIEPEEVPTPAVQAEPAFVEPVEAPVVEEITVTVPQPEETVTVSEAPAVEITENTPSVMFSFGTQEFHGRGWKVCFSF